MKQVKQLEQLEQFYTPKTAKIVAKTRLLERFIGVF